MMNAGREEPSDPRVLEELPPGLRDAVEQVLRDPLPQNLVRCAMERAQRCLTPGEHCGAEAASGRRTRTAGYYRIRMVLWALLATSASIAMIATALRFRPVGADVSEVVSSPPHEIVAPGTADVPSLNVPTAWAYRQAVRESPEAIDALLDLHARRAFSADRPPPPGLASWGGLPPVF